MRTLLILSNSRNFKPRDSTSLKQKLSPYFQRVNVRVAASHIEISVEVEDLDDASWRIQSVTGESVLEAKILGSDPPLGISEALLLYEDLVRRERFWEAHEVLEGVWRINRDEGLQALILTAAALAKAQEGNLIGALKITSRISRLAEGGLVDVDCLRETVREAYEGGNAGARMLACVSRLAP